VFRIGWRLQRTGLLSMSAFGVLYGVIQAAAYRSAAGSTVASRVAFGHEMETFGRSYTFLLPVPERLETLSGYVQWRVYGGLVLLFAVWALMSATGASRGDEERGLVDEWLSSGVGRWRYVASRVCGFTLAAAIVAAASSAAVDLTAVVSGLSIAFGALFEETLLLVVLMFCCYAIAMLLAQFPSRRAAAAGLGGLVLAGLFFVNSFGRTDESLRSLARLISPFYYVDRSTPLTPGGSFDTAATVGLLVVALGLLAIAAWLMQLRDIGSPLLRPGRHDQVAEHLPSDNRLLATPVLSFLYEQRYGLLLWVGGSAIGATYMPSVGRSMVNLVKEPGSFHAYLTVVGHGNAYLALTAYVWFGIFQLALVAFAMTNVARWSSDDNEGRLEMQLSAPVSRTRIVAERALVFMTGASVIIAVSSAAFYLSSSASGITVNVRDLAVASLTLLPFVLTFGALGAALTSRVPRAAIGLLAAVAFCSYLITIAGPLLKWPEWVTNLSAFSLYGMPLTKGVYWVGLWIMLGISASGFGVATVLMHGRDVGS
jgi:ABC-2 type transport system permease protein